MTPNQYCQNKASSSGSSFYYSFLFLSPEKRQAITALYAFCREVDDIVDECHDTSLAQQKLDWWKSSMRETFEYSPNHPIQQALLPAIERYDLPLQYFLDIIAGMEMDLHKFRYETFDELSLYCYRVAGAVGLLLVKIMGYYDKSVEKYAKDLGLAFQLTNILRDIKEDAERNRIYLPLQELAQRGLSEKEILNAEISDNMQDLLDFQIERARGYYQSAFENLPSQERESQRCGVIMSSIYYAILDKIATDPGAVLKRRVSIPTWKKLWLAWNTARSERQQKFCNPHGINSHRSRQY